MAVLVVTVIGDDRSGLVDALAGAVADHGGNWHRSHLTELAGKFAGIVMVTVPDVRADELVGALTALEGQGLFDVTVEYASASAAVGSAALDDAEAPRMLSLELVGQDRPGIVHEISETLAGHRVSIADLMTETTSAPMAGGLLFKASAKLEVPADVALDDLRVELEALANELMVDLDLDG